MLYATCSILKNENEDQIAQFLHNHLDAIEEKITLDWGLEATHGKQQIPCYELMAFIMLHSKIDVE
ncbi:hypothetical protein BSPWISOXPB_2286 [uncultured Gammaproteobacteria bacterium]|nr:hypothetical protein BSPWISOXPB_2286 [uncultured Gammaproteobacteria bacterium]